MRKKKPQTIRQMPTERGSQLPEIPWVIYPRPQMVRDDWQCLNGDWQFCFLTGNSNPDYAETIRVPFCPESMLSGIGRTGNERMTLCYRKTWSAPPEWRKRNRRVLLHFGAVDQYAIVSCNGKVVGVHKGGYLPFSFDISDIVQEQNILEVCATDNLSHLEPWGKQKTDRGGMWYTPVSGIWQTVWAESVPRVYIRELKIETDEKGATVTPVGISDGVLTLEGRDYPMRKGSFRVEPDNVRKWSPEDPYLYRFVIQSKEDKVQSYFAIRTLDIREIDGRRRLCLNGKPYFFHGLLDQGYWSDGIYTPAKPECYTDDIEKMKALGFNTLRKHIKIEPERFYYECDRLGMVVFQDMVNCGDYSFLHDTVLPTLGMTKLSDRKHNNDKRTRENFLQYMRDTVHTLQNHPCVCYWTIFNEGWGQFCADDVYDELKKLDPTRFVDAASGWFRQQKSDVDSLHVYFKDIRAEAGERPLVLSECGGYAYKIPEHSTNLKKTYGYRKFKSREEFVRALRALYQEQIIPLIPKGLCAAIYTQVSDVEDETNGLLTYDRMEAKVTPEEFLDISKEMKI